MKYNTRIENCLIDYKKIDYKIRDRYDLKVADLKNIIEETVKSSPEPIWDIISCAFKMGFTLGRRSAL